jgi:hypothetical protein
MLLTPGGRRRGGVPRRRPGQRHLMVDRSCRPPRAALAATGLVGDAPAVSPSPSQEDPQPRRGRCSQGGPSRPVTNATRRPRYGGSSRGPRSLLRAATRGPHRPWRRPRGSRRSPGSTCATATAQGALSASIVRLGRGEPLAATVAGARRTCTGPRGGPPQIRAGGPSATTSPPDPLRRPVPRACAFSRSAAHQAPGVASTPISAPIRRREGLVSGRRGRSASPPGQANAPVLRYLSGRRAWTSLRGRTSPSPSLPGRDTPHEGLNHRRRDPGDVLGTLFSAPGTDRRHLGHAEVGRAGAARSSGGQVVGDAGLAALGAGLVLAVPDRAIVVAIGGLRGRPAPRRGGGTLLGALPPGCSQACAPGAAADRSTAADVRRRRDGDRVAPGSFYFLEGDTEAVGVLRGVVSRSAAGRSPDSAQSGSRSRLRASNTS